MTEEILLYVKNVRKERNIVPVLRLHTKPFREMSGEAYNEFDMLIYVQLVPTLEYGGAWHELEDSEICTAVYRRILEQKK